MKKKRNERPNVGGVSNRSRNGAQSRKGCVVNVNDYSKHQNEYTPLPLEYSSGCGVTGPKDEQKQRLGHSIRHCVHLAKRERSSEGQAGHARREHPPHFSLYFFFHPIYFFVFFSLSLLVVSQIRGHIAGSYPPLPTTVRALRLFREKISALCSLVDLSRTVLTHTRRSQQLLILL